MHKKMVVEHVEIRLRVPRHDGSRTHPTSPDFPDEEFILKFEHAVAFVKAMLLHGQGLAAKLDMAPYFQDRGYSSYITAHPWG